MPGKTVPALGALFSVGGWKERTEGARGAGYCALESRGGIAVWGSAGGSRALEKSHSRQLTGT